jgi:hypothetical protein
VIKWGEHCDCGSVSRVRGGQVDVAAAKLKLKYAKFNSEAPKLNQQRPKAEILPGLYRPKPPNRSSWQRQHFFKFKQLLINECVSSLLSLFPYHASSPSLARSAQLSLAQAAMPYVLLYYAPDLSYLPSTRAYPVPRLRRT